MPPFGCSSGLLVTAGLLFLIIPVQYYLPDFKSKAVLPVEPLLQRPAPDSPQAIQWTSLENVPPFHLLLTVSLLLLATVIYLCDWIQRKLMERRILKLKRYLNESLERLRQWDARQEQLEGALRMVTGATAEYNLLLFLLLRQSQLAPHPQAPRTFDKDLDDIHCARSTVDI